LARRALGWQKVARPATAWQPLLMKLLLALLLLGALTAAAVLVPLSGETAWQHAERKGWPLAAAHGFARAANAGAHWVFATLRGHDDAPKKAQPTRTPRRRLARIPTPVGGNGAGSGIARAAPPSTAPPAQAAGTRDHVVPAPPAERLEGPDRAALDKLITARGGR
jgi:hypothetical protein